MIRYCLIAGLLLQTFSLLAQRSLPAAYPAGIKTNYVRSWDIMVPETNPNTVITKTYSSVKQSTQYFDGLGRPLQTVGKQASLVTGGTPLDMISASVYDSFGREQVKYLPFASTAVDATKNNGLLKTNPFQQQAVFYNTQLSGQSGETNIGPNNLNWAYSQTSFEGSPLNRPLESFAPGSSWVGSAGEASEANRRSVKAKLWNNTLPDSVRIWNVTDVAGAFSSYATPAGSAGIYPAGQLSKSVTADEHGNQVIEFKDKTGLVILKKVQNTSVADTGTGKGHTGWLCTYYIYDNLNRLRCVLQPRGVELIAANWVLTNAT